MRLIDADELYAKLMQRYLMHNMKNDRLDMAARAAVGSCMEAVERSKTVSADPLPNEPLTLEELREMGGKPVWLEVVGGDGHWVMFYGVQYENAYACFYNEISRPFSKYGETWLAYRRKPEGSI